MRIGVNTLSVIPRTVGGGETYLSRLLAAVVPALGESEQLTLFVTKENAGLFPPVGRRVRHVVLPVPQRLRPARLLIEHLILPALLVVRPVDVLLSPGNAIPPLAGVRHVLALQSMHYRYVASEMSAFRVKYFRLMVPLSANRAARVVCMSEDLRRSLAEVAGRSAARAEVIHEGADLSALTPTGPKEEGDDFLLFVSSLNRFKRPDSLVRALAHLRRSGFEPPPARFVGRPDAADRERVEALARDEGVSDLVRIEGVVEHERLPAIYRSARLLVYPSAVETFGLPPLEAMACGCPVVASNCTSVPEIVGNAALVVDPDDIPGVAGAIRRCLTDEELRTDLRKRGFANVRRFTWEQAAEETLQALRGACRTLKFGRAALPR